MKIHGINVFFRAVGSLQIRYRWHLLVFTVVLAGIGISGIMHVKSANSRDSWFSGGEAIKIATDKFEQQFGNNEVIGLLIESDDVFHPEVLSMIKAIGDELLEKVPYADEVTSLTDIEISVGTEEGMNVINPFEDGIPESPEKIEEARRLILSKKSLVNKIVSDDCTETWLSLALHEYPEEKEWKKNSNKDPMFQSGEAAMAVVTDPKWKSDRYTIKPAGLPYTETEERDYFGKEAMVRVLSGFVLMILVLAILLRSFRGVFVPVFTTVFGIITVFGIMGRSGIEVDANFVTLPVLLGMALSVGYSVHLVNAFKRLFRITGKRTESIISAVEETGWPILFTVLTTIGSVMSFATTGIPAIGWLGFTSAAVVFAVYLFVIVLTPVLMSFGGDKKTDTVYIDNKKQDDKLMDGLGRFVLGNKTAILIVSTIFIAVLSAGIMKLSVNMDSFKFMGLRVPYIKRVHEVVNSRLGAYLSYDITISYSEKDAIKNPVVMKKFEKLLDFVGSFELTKKDKGVANVFSVLDILKEMNQTFHKDSVSRYSVPDKRDLIVQLLFLYEISGGTKTFRWIDEDYSMLRAQVNISRFEANEIVRELALIKAFGEKNFPGAEVAIIGSAVQFAEMNKKIVMGELKSMFTALATICVLLIAVFGSLKTGLIGMIPNVAPLVVLGGFMGYCGIHLDMMTMTIMPMLLGIAVDDTIHMINHIKYEFERSGNYRTAVMDSLNKVGKTLLMTTVVLSATFSMYMFSSIAALMRIGLLASMGLIVALIADYLLTPLLIYITRPFGKERNN